MKIHDKSIIFYDNIFSRRIKIILILITIENFMNFIKIEILEFNSRVPKVTKIKVTKVDKNILGI